MSGYDYSMAPGACLLVNDKFGVCNSLLKLSLHAKYGLLANNVGPKLIRESPIDVHYSLSVQSKYFTAEGRIITFPTVDAYQIWCNSPTDISYTPVALFICVDIDIDEDELQSFFDKLIRMKCELFLDTKAMLLFGNIPDLGNDADVHPKWEIIRKFVEKSYFEIVLFNPNANERRALAERRELFGIERTWELIQNADWTCMKLTGHGKLAYAKSESMSAPKEINVITITREHPKKEKVLDLNREPFSDRDKLNILRLFMQPLPPFPAIDRSAAANIFHCDDYDQDNDVEANASQPSGKCQSTHRKKSKRQQKIPLIQIVDETEPDKEKTAERGTAAQETLTVQQSSHQKHKKRKWKGKSARSGPSTSGLPVTAKTLGASDCESGINSLSINDPQ